MLPWPARWRGQFATIISLGTRASCLAKWSAMSPFCTAALPVDLIHGIVAEPRPAPRSADSVRLARQSERSMNAVQEEPHARKMITQSWTADTALLPRDLQMRMPWLSKAITQLEHVSSQA